MRIRCAVCPEPNVFCIECFSARVELGEYAQAHVCASMYVVCVCLCRYLYMCTRMCGIHVYSCVQLHTAWRVQLSYIDRICVALAHWIVIQNDYCQQLPNRARQASRSLFTFALCRARCLEQRLSLVTFGRICPTDMWGSR